VLGNGVNLRQLVNILVIDVPIKKETRELCLHANGRLLAQ